MKIAVIGSEHAGKTTFLCALSEYCRTTPGLPLEFNPANAATNRYVAERIAILKRGEWVPQTAQKDFNVLRWELRNNLSKTISELHMADIAGHDFRTFITQDNHLKADKDISEEHRMILEYITTADAIVMVVDFNSFLVQDAAVQADNRFLVEVLRHPLMANKKRILIGTKADLFPGKSADDLLMANGLNIPPEVQRLMVAPVPTELRSCGLRTARMPRTPLRSEGMEQVVATLLICLQAKKTKDIFRMIRWGAAGLGAAALVTATAPIGVPLAVIGGVGMAAAGYNRDKIKKTIGAKKSVMSFFSCFLVFLLTAPFTHAAISDIPELKPVIKDTVKQSYGEANYGKITGKNLFGGNSEQDQPGGRAISIRREDTNGDDCYHVNNISTSAIVKIKIFHRGVLKGELGRLPAGKTYVFNGIPDEWGGGDENQVSIEYNREEKSHYRRLMEIAQEAADYVDTDATKKNVEELSKLLTPFDLNEQQQFVSNPKINSLFHQTIEAAAKKEGSWTFSGGKSWSKKWRTMLETLKK